MTIESEGGGSMLLPKGGNYLLVNTVHFPRRLINCSALL